MTEQLWDKATFDKNYKSVKTTMTRMKKQVHAFAVQAIWHAQEHGDTTYINRLYDILTKGQQASFRRYIIAVTAKKLDDLSSTWVARKKGEFIMNPDFKGKKRQAYFRQRVKDDNGNTISEELKLKDAGELMDLPSFLDVDPDKVKDPFKVDSALKQLKTLESRMQSERDEHGEEKTGISENAIAVVAAAAEGLENMVPQGNA